MTSAVGVVRAGRSRATVRPSLSTVTRSPISRISSSRCEMYTTATPSAVSSRMTRKRLRTSSGSSTAEGSSMTISRASRASARAMLTTCCPAAESRPSSRRGGISGCPRRASSARVTRSASRGRVNPNRDGSWPSTTFSATDRPGTRSSSWWIVAIPARSAACGEANVVGLPSHTTSPSSGRCAPASTLISVDFPAPFCPSRQCTSPASTSRSTPSRARTPGNCLTMPRIASSGSAIVPPLRRARGGR